MHRNMICMLSAALLLVAAGNALGQEGLDGWWDEDIGTTGGSASQKNGVFTIIGDGADIWDAADHFHYVYKQLTGDGSITARVVDHGSGSNTWAKGGVMIRANNTPGSADVYMVITDNQDGAAGNGAGFQWRNSQGAGAGWDESGPATVVDPPQWVRLDRLGNSFSAYYSANGTDWTQLHGAHTVNMTDPVLIGLCVTSHAAGELRTYVFDNVSYTGNVTDRPPQLKAFDPDPADGTIIMMPLFQWAVGETALFHNVYLGASPELTSADLVAPSLPFTMYYHMLPLTPGQTYYWRVDEIEPDMVTVHTGDVWSFLTAPLTAYQPMPADTSMYQSLDTDLAWSPGQSAINHDVYFSTDKDAVAAGDASALLISQAAPLFDLDPLPMNTTYYWRVDETDSGGAKHVGDVWSFTTTIPGLGKVKRELWNNIGAGVSVDDLLSAPAYPGNPSDVNEMDTFESPEGIGDNYGGRLSAWLHVPVAGDYTFWVAGDDNTRLYFGADQDSAELIAEVPGWSAARAWDNEPGQKSDPIALEAGRYYIAALWKEGGGGDNCSAAWQGPGVPVRELINGSYCKPFEALWAFGPRPRDNAVDAAHTSQLAWSPGVKTVQQQIYFGDDADAVANADTTTTGIYRGQQSVDNSTFDPGMLEFGKTYYWRVDQSDPADPESPWEGSVWSFTVATFIVVDNFESYVDDVIGRIFQTWIDGWGYTEPPPGDPGNGTGATVGYLDPPFAEQTVVHGGAQSMPFDYNNIIPPYYSETERTWAAPQNWTLNDVDTLSLWVRGNQASSTVNETAPGAFSVTGEGVDIWGVSDQFTYVFKTLNGNGSLVARVVDVGTGSNNWTKGGVMIRDTLAAGSTHASQVITGGEGNGASFQWRPVADDVSSNSDAVDPVAPPYWVKIERLGNSLSAYLSPNGTTWTQQGVSQVIFMTQPLYIGLCVTSHTAGENRTFEFDNVMASGAVGQWQAQDIGLTRNDPATLYVAVQDSTGTIKAVPNADPGLVNVTDWTEWPIPLTEFGNVNMTRVKKMLIGVGNRDFPQPGGHGMLFIDDVHVVKPAPPEPDGE